MKKPAEKPSLKASSTGSALSPADLEAAERLIAQNTRHAKIDVAGQSGPVRPIFLRRGPMENLATALIAAGFLMMFQPFALPLYSWSFLTMLAGTLMFVIVSKFPE